MKIVGPTQEYRVIQIHPLLKCNLRCAHCYSTSGPGRLETLPASKVQMAVEILCAEGYNGVGISGGEPLLYPELAHHRANDLAIAMPADQSMDRRRVVGGRPASQHRQRRHQRQMLMPEAEHGRRTGSMRSEIFRAVERPAIGAQGEP